MSGEPERGAPAPVPNWRAALAALEGAYARGTLKVIGSHFELFESWCAARGHGSLPATEAVLAAHVADIFPCLATASVRGRLWSVRTIHMLLELPDHTRGRRVRYEFRRGLRLYGRNAWQAMPIYYADKERLLAACPPTLRGLRDRLMIGLAYDTLCRSCELMALQLEDVAYLDNGTARIEVRAAKNDIYRQGGQAYVSPATAADLKAWTRATGLRSGPILRAVDRAGALPGGLTGQVLKDRLRRLGRKAKLPDAERFSRNSLRVGAAQDLVVAGCSLLEVMRAGRWRDARVVSRYARQAPINVWATVRAQAGAGGTRLVRSAIVRPPNRTAWLADPHLTEQHVEVDPASGEVDEGIGGPTR